MAFSKDPPTIYLSPACSVVGERSLPRLLSPGGNHPGISEARRPERSVQPAAAVNSLTLIDFEKI